MKICKSTTILFYFILLLSMAAFTVISQVAYTQTVVFEEQVDTNPDYSSTGPNKKNFVHLFIGFGCIVGPSENVGANIKYGQSADFEIGYRYKRKISNFYAWGVEMQYHGNGYVLKQDSAKILPNSILHKKEIFRFYNIGAGIYNRINIGKRGNIIGNYMDVGANVEFPFSIVHDIKNDGPNGTIVRTLTTHLDYVNKFNYYGFLRLGSNRFSVKTSYRFSDLFKKTEANDFPELPRFTVSLQVGVHK